MREYAKNNMYRVLCIKRLGEDYSDGSVGDWTKSPPGVTVFVDPREF